MLQRVLARRAGRLITLFLMLVLVGALILTIFTRSTQAASSGSQMQLLSSNFAQRTIPTDGVTAAALITLPFSLPQSGHIEASALFFLEIVDAADPGKSAIVDGEVGTLTCALVLDTTMIGTVTSGYLHAYNLQDQEYGVTATTAVRAGSHKLALICVGTLTPTPGVPPTLVMKVTGNGLSAIVIDQ